jgi:hypothetical protein
MLFVFTFYQVIKKLFVDNILMTASIWKFFTKAGQPGWASLIPIYNLIKLLKIVGRPLWWIVLFIIPLANIVAIIIVYIDLAQSFGKGTGFGIGMLLVPFVFLPMLAFGDAEYEGPAAARQANRL